MPRDTDLRSEATAGSGSSEFSDASRRLSDASLFGSFFFLAQQHSNSSMQMCATLTATGGWVDLAMAGLLKATPAAASGTQGRSKIAIAPVRAAVAPSSW